METMQAEQFVFGQILDTAIVDGRISVCASSISNDSIEGALKRSTQIGDHFCTDDAFSAYAFASTTVQQNVWIVLSHFRSMSERMQRGGRFFIPSYHIAFPLDQFRRIHYDTQWLLDHSTPLPDFTEPYKTFEKLDVLPIPIGVQSWESRIQHLWGMLSEYSSRLPSLVAGLFSPPLYVQDFHGAPEERLHICQLLHLLVPMHLIPSVSFTTALLNTLPAGTEPGLQFVDDNDNVPTDRGTVFNWQTDSMDEGQRISALAHRYGQEVVEMLERNDLSALRHIHELDGTQVDPSDQSQQEWDKLAKVIYGQWSNVRPLSVVQVTAQHAIEKLNASDWIQLWQHEQIAPGRQRVAACIVLLKEILRQQTVKTDPSDIYRNCFFSLATQMSENEKQGLIKNAHIIVRDFSTATAFSLWIAWANDHDNGVVADCLYQLALALLAPVENQTELRLRYTELWQSVESCPILQDARDDWLFKIAKHFLNHQVNRASLSIVTTWLLSDVVASGKVLKRIAILVASKQGHLLETVSPDLCIIYLASQTNNSTLITADNLHLLYRSLNRANGDQNPLTQNKIVLEAARWFVQIYPSVNDKQFDILESFRLLAIACAIGDDQLTYNRLESWVAQWHQKRSSSDEIEDGLSEFTSQLQQLLDNRYEFSPNESLLDIWLDAVNADQRSMETFTKDWQRLSQYEPHAWEKYLASQLDMRGAAYLPIVFSLIEDRSDQSQAQSPVLNTLIQMFQSEFEAWLCGERQAMPNIQRFSDAVGQNDAKFCMLQTWLPQAISQTNITDRVGTVNRAIDVLDVLNRSLNVAWTDVEKLIEYLLQVSIQLNGRYFLDIAERMIELDLIGLNSEQIYDNLLPPLVQNLQTGEQLRALLRWVFWTRNLREFPTLLTDEQVGQVLCALTPSPHLDEQLPKIAMFLKTWNHVRQHPDAKSNLDLTILLNCNAELQDRESSAGLISCLVNEYWSRHAGQDESDVLSISISNSSVETLLQFVEHLAWLAGKKPTTGALDEAYRRTIESTMSLLVHSSDLLSRWREHPELVRTRSRLSGFHSLSKWAIHLPKPQNRESCFVMLLVRRIWKTSNSAAVNCVMLDTAKSTIKSSSIHFNISQCLMGRTV